MAESYNICLDVGGTKVLGAIFNEKDKIIYRLKKRSKSGGEGSADVEKVIISVVEEMIKESGIDKKKVNAVASCAPGVIDQEKGIVLFTPNLPWRDYDIASAMRKKFGVPFYAGKRPWEQKVDIVMPCATQNEVEIADAKNIVANGVKYYVEVSNMPTTAEAVSYLKENGVVIAPSKAVNAGGVAVSGLEMSQNSMRYSWTAEEVDAKLHQIMTNIFKASYEAAEAYGMKGDLIAGANIAGFLKVAEAMKAQGVV